MAFTKMTDDLDIIAKYPDEPYEEEGFTSTAFKASFDQGAKLCKDAINRLVEELNSFVNGLRSSATARVIGFLRSTSVPADNVQDAIENVQAQLVSMTQGTVANGSIDEYKLASPAVKEPNIYDDAVTGPKIRDEAVTGAKILAGSLLEDVTADVALACVSEHPFESHIKFMYSRALGVVFVTGLVMITPTENDPSINVNCTMSDYLPDYGLYLPAVSDNIDVETVLADFTTSGLAIMSTYYGTSSQPGGAKSVHVNGFYPCAGAGTEA